MNWYEEKELRKKTKERAEEIAARNPELAERYRKCREIVDARLKSVDQKLGGMEEWKTRKP